MSLTRSVGEYRAGGEGVSGRELADTPLPAIAVLPHPPAADEGEKWSVIVAPVDEQGTKIVTYNL